MTPKEAAIDLIKHYVERGDSISNLRSSWMYVAGGRYTASIGGSIFPKEYHEKGNFLECPNSQIQRVGSDKILVKEVDGKIVNEVFSLYEIFQIIKNKKGIQLSLI